LQSYLSSCEASYPDELAGTLHRLKTRFFEQMVREGRIGLRPGVAYFVRALQKEGIRLFVATTGTRAWVDPLLRAHFEPGTFEHVVTGTEVPRLKPEPDVYLHVLDLGELPADDVLAVEDSANGLEAADRAGIACVVVRNEYTAGDLSKAALVADSFEADGIRDLFCRR
jgi:HAD superfamily hydrolase (TIGR01509 family)